MNLLISGFIGLIAVVSGYFAVAPETYDDTTVETEKENLGAVSYPTSLDSFTNPSATDRTNVLSHSSQHGDANDAIEALEAKVGADSSAVTTSHDYKLSTITGSDKAVSLAGTQTLTNKTLTSPFMTTMTATNSSMYGTTTITGTTTINTSGKALGLTLGSDATGDIFYKNSLGYLTRLGIGSSGQFLLVDSGLPSWQTASPVLDMDLYTSNASGVSSVSIPITASDELVIWAQFNRSDSCVAGSAEKVAGSITYRQSTEGATTTVTTVENSGSGGTIDCTAVAIGSFTATTTATISVAGVLTDGNTSRLIVQHYIK
jgi:hypothetical protein